MILQLSSFDPYLFHPLFFKHHTQNHQAVKKMLLKKNSKMTLMMTASWKMLLTDWVDAAGFQLERYARPRFDEDYLSFYRLVILSLDEDGLCTYVKLILKLYLKVMKVKRWIHTWWWYLFLHTCWWSRLLEAENMMCELIQHQGIYVYWMDGKNIEFVANPMSTWFQIHQTPRNVYTCVHFFCCPIFAHLNIHSTMTRIPISDVEGADFLQRFKWFWSWCWLGWWWYGNGAYARIYEALTANSK